MKTNRFALGGRLVLECAGGVDLGRCAESRLRILVSGETGADELR